MNGENLTSFLSKVEVIPPHNENISEPIWITGVHEYRRTIWEHYDWHSLEYYKAMVRVTCPHMQLNTEGSIDIERFKKQHNFPDFRSRSVAFHVRRTDKLIQEARLYTGDEYVAKLVAVAPRDEIEHCYVATDDEKAVEEIKVSLVSFNVTCQVYSLVHGAYTLMNRETVAHGLILVTELSIMTDASYFVGTFGSSISRLATVLRGCNSPEAANYSRSFGVDQETWLMQRF
jgi:Alpha-(1,6)-fucosyltransferase N- and catalytic domains